MKKGKATIELEIVTKRRVKALSLAVFWKFEMIN